MFFDVGGQPASQLFRLKLQFDEEVTIETQPIHARSSDPRVVPLQRIPSLSYRVTAARTTLYGQGIMAMRIDLATPTTKLQLHKPPLMLPNAYSAA